MTLEQYRDIFECVLPIILIILAFMLKLFIDKRVKKVDVISNLIDLPFDIIMQATVFIIAFTIIPENNIYLGLIFFIFYIILLIIVIVIKGRTREYFDQSRIGLLIGFTSICYLISVPSLIYSILLIVGDT